MEAESGPPEDPLFQDFFIFGPFCFIITNSGGTEFEIGRFWGAQNGPQKGPQIEPDRGPKWELKSGPKSTPKSDPERDPKSDPKSDPDRRPEIDPKFPTSNPNGA